MHDSAGQPANPFEGKTYAQSVEILAERYGERRALVFRDRRYSFRDVRAEVDNATRRLATLGLARGDRIAIWLPNRPEFICPKQLRSSRLPPLSGAPSAGELPLEVCSPLSYRSQSCA